MFAFPIGFFPGSSFGQNDPYWSNVSLLLPMTGADGSTVFTDQSLAPKTITANGNAQISTAQSYFGGGSGYFDGSGAYLSVSNGGAFNYLSSESFTIELFFYNTSSETAGGGANGIIATNTVTGLNGFLLGWFPDNDNFYYRFNTSTSTSTFVMARNQWHYLALVQVAGVSLKVWLNGEEKLSFAATTFSTTNALTIAKTPGSELRHQKGYFNHLRITKGVARDVSVVPTAPFPIG